MVNGLPVGYLPNDYRTHATYLALFGDAPLEVTPSSEQGMCFVGKTKHSGHTVHLGKEASDLLVRVVNDHGTFELIPRRKLAGVFPIFYVERFVHWYNVDEGYIMFCAAQFPWDFSQNTWKLTGCQGSWKLANDSCSLLNFQSPGNKIISRLL